MRVVLDIEGKSTRRVKAWRAANPRKEMLIRNKARAKRKGIIFTITLEDIPEIPTHCPVLKTPMFMPSLDRLIPGLGYIPGNVRVISQRANRIKADATIEELERVLSDARNIGH